MAIKKSAGVRSINALVNHVNKNKIGINPIETITRTISLKRNFSKVGAAPISESIFLVLFF